MITQYTVDEHYLDKDLDVYTNDKLDEKKSAELAQTKAYEYIVDICRKSSNGNLLFFANGQREIIEAVKYLNENLPLECIAIPYFSEMNQSKNDKIMVQLENIEILLKCNYVITIICGMISLFK